MLISLAISFPIILFVFFFFFFNDTATTEIYTLSLHDALPICPCGVPSSYYASIHLHVKRVLPSLGSGVAGRLPTPSGVGATLRRLRQCERATKGVAVVAVPGEQRVEPLPLRLRVEPRVPLAGLRDELGRGLDLVGRTPTLGQERSGARDVLVRDALRAQLLLELAPSRWPPSPAAGEPGARELGVVDQAHLGEPTDDLGDRGRRVALVLQPAREVAAGAAGALEQLERRLAAGGGVGGIDRLRISSSAHGSHAGRVEVERAHGRPPPGSASLACGDYLRRSAGTAIGTAFTGVTPGAGATGAFGASPFAVLFGIGALSPSAGSTLASILARMSACSRRKSRVFSRPCPRRSSPKLNHVPALPITFFSTAMSMSSPSREMPWL